MSKDAINFLTNLKEEVNKYIADMDLEAVEKAADIIMDAESKGNRVHVTGIGNQAMLRDMWLVCCLLQEHQLMNCMVQKLFMDQVVRFYLEML